MKNFKKIKYLILIIVLVPFLTFAQNGTPPDNTTSINITNPAKCGGGNDCSDLISLLRAILNNVVMPVAAVAVVMWIIWAGFSYLMAQGNEKKIEVAHQRLLWSLIGAGILLGAAGISAVVQSTIEALTK